MAVERILSSSSFARNQATIAIDIPINSSGDIVIAHVIGAFHSPTSGPTISSASAGWAQASAGESTKNGIGELGHDVTAFYTAYTRAGSVSGTFSVTFNVSGQNNSHIGIYMEVYTGADSATPLEAVAKNGTSGTSHGVTGGNTTVADTLIIAAWIGANNAVPSLVNPIEITPPVSMSSGGNIYGGSGSGFTDWLSYAFRIGEEYKSGTGAIGTKTATSSISYDDLQVASYIFAIRPYQGPSIPVIIAPTTGESITIGRTYVLSCNPSTDPNTAQSALTYTWKYSLNNGLTKTTIGTGAAGVTTMNWNTSGLTPTTQARIYCFASDGTNNSQEGFTGQFILAADLPPGPPQNLTPNGGSLDRASNQTVTWQFNDTGDVQSERTWEWGTDGITFGNVSTVATSSSSIALTGGVGILATRGQKYHRVKVEDNAGTASAYSSTSTFFAGDKPATPNITSPTAGSPPTTSNPTYSFTSSSAFTQRRIRIVEGGATVFTQTTVSTATSFTENYALANSLTYTIFLSVLGIDGIWSDEDSETFTPSFTGPATPTLTLTTNTAEGTIQVAAGNSDTPDRQEVWRFASGQTANDAIRLTKTMVANGTFIDSHVKSGVTYHYWIRAYSGNLFTDSAVDSISVALSSLHIDVATKTSSTSNRSGLLYVGLDNQAPMEYSQSYISSRDKTKGNTKPTTAYTQTKTRRLRATIRTKNADYNNVIRLREIFAVNSTICIRDQMGNLIFAKLRIVPEQDAHYINDIVIDETEAYYVEHVS